jgi:uncharacterized protein (DUF433 family)
VRDRSLGSIGVTEGSSDWPVWPYSEVMTISIVAEAPPLHADAHGVLRIGATRVSLDSVLASFQAGSTPERIAQQFPTLELADIYHVVAYYLRHRGDVDGYLAAGQEADQRVREDMSKRFPQEGIRARLLARVKP